MRFKRIHLALIGGAHGAARTVDRDIGVVAATAGQRGLGLVEFAHAGFKDAFHRADPAVAVLAVGRGVLVQGIEIAAGPEGAFEFLGLAARAADGKHLAENIHPAHDGNPNQQSEDQLDQQRSFGNECVDEKGICERSI